MNFLVCRIQDYLLVHFTLRIAFVVAANRLKRVREQYICLSMLSLIASQHNNLTALVRLEEAMHSLQVYALHLLLLLQMLVFLLSVVFINVGRALHIRLVILRLRLCRALEERRVSKFCARV